MEAPPRDTLAESIIETIRDPLLVLDAKLRVIKASREFYRTFQAAQEETVGRLVYDLGNRQWDIPALRNLLEEILPNQTTFRDFEVTYVFEHIGRKVMILNARKVRHQESELILLAIEDITERRRLEDERRELETRFTSLVKNIREHSIFTLDPQGRITSWNREAENILGYSEADVLGQHFSLIFSPEDRRDGIPAQELRLALSEGRAEDERWHLRKGGERFWALGIVTPTQDANGTHTGFSKILRDVTGRKRAEEAMRISEERYRLIVEAARDYAILTTDPAGLITSWSPGAEAVFGWSAGEAIGQDVSMTFTLEDKANAAPEQERLTARQKGSAPDVRWHLRKDGARVFIEGVMRAFGHGFLKVGHDVTERRRADERLRENEERLRVALAAGEMGTWLRRIPQDEQIVDESLRHLMGLPPGHDLMTMEKFLQAVHPDDRPKVSEEFERCLVGEDFNVEFRVIWPDGPIHWLKDQGKAFSGAEGPLFMAGAAMDITERKRAEEALQLADRRKEEFLATLAHELRNPLAPLRNGLQLIRLTPDRAAREHAREMMHRQLGQLVRLVDDLMDVSRISRNKLELRKARIDLWTVVQGAIETARPQIEAKGHELRVSLPSEPVYLDGDLTRLAQVFWNLLNNSAKYTEPGGSIRLFAETDGNVGVVTVQDNGIGIPPESLPGLFEMFSQVDRSLERAEGGLGIGLALVKGLTEAHGGSVEAKSEGLGHGSSFIVRLPVTQGTIAPDKLERHEAATSGRKHRILVVDDNRDGAASLATLLTIKGNETRTAHNGLEGVEMAEAFRPDLIVLDIGLPKLNGFDACRRIREQPWAKNTLIVAATGWGQEKDRRRSKDAGFDHHLVKP